MLDQFIHQHFGIGIVHIIIAGSMNNTKGYPLGFSIGNGSLYKIFPISCGNPMYRS